VNAPSAACGTRSDLAAVSRVAVLEPGIAAAAKRGSSQRSNQQASSCSACRLELRVLTSSEREDNATLGKASESPVIQPHAEDVPQRQSRFKKVPRSRSRPRALTPATGPGQNAGAASAPVGATTTRGPESGLPWSGQHKRAPRMRPTAPARERSYGGQCRQRTDTALTAAGHVCPGVVMARVRCCRLLRSGHRKPCRHRAWVNG